MLLILPLRGEPPGRSGLCLAVCSSPRGHQLDVAVVAGPAQWPKSGNPSPLPAPLAEVNPPLTAKIPQ